MSLPTPNYVTTEEVTIVVASGEKHTLPVGAFVRPIEDRWVPKDLLEAAQKGWYNRDKECFCYTRYGIGLIRNDSIRRT